MPQKSRERRKCNNKSGGGCLLRIESQPHKERYDDISPTDAPNKTPYRNNQLRPSFMCSTAWGLNLGEPLDYTKAKEGPNDNDGNKKMFIVEIQQVKNKEGKNYQWGTEKCVSNHATVSDHVSETGSTMPYCFIFRHRTPKRIIGSAWVLVGSTPSWRRKVQRCAISLCNR